MIVPRGKSYKWRGKNHVRMLLASDKLAGECNLFGSTLGHFCVLKLHIHNAWCLCTASVRHTCICIATQSCMPVKQRAGQLSTVSVVQHASNPCTSS